MTKYARLVISKNRWNMREKSVPIVIFAQYRNQYDYTVYAPKSRIIFEGEFENPVCTTPDVQILIPVWVFAKNDAPVWNADGYIEMVEM